MSPANTGIGDGDGLHAALVAALTAYAPVGDAQRRLRQEFLDQLADHTDAVWRSGPPEHLTTSAYVLSAELDAVLLVLHKKARLWLQPGGHLEPEDADPAAAALREATEETGITGLRLLPGVAHLDRHTLAGSFGRCREHLDVRYVAIAPAGAQPVVSQESDAAAWWPIAALPADTDPALPSAIRSAATGVTAAQLASR